jgi:hypothetical protein
MYVGIMVDQDWNAGCSERGVQVGLHSPSMATIVLAYDIGQ